MKGHVRQRGPTAWEIKYDAPTDPVTGRRVTKTKTVHGAKRDAQRELRAILTAVDGGTYTDASKMTVAQWLNQWLEEAKPNLARKTYYRYKGIVSHHLLPAFGTMLLAKLQPVHIQRHYTDALAGGRKRGEGGLSPTTVRQHDRVLNVALKRARSLKLIASNPVADVSRPQAVRHEMEYLEPADAAALLATVSRTRMFPIIFLALATGLRRGELLGLRWSDIDLDRRSLTIAQSLEQTSDGLAFKLPKTRRSRRTIALSASLVEELRAHRVRQAEERLALGLGRALPSGLLFTTIDGEPIKPDSLSQQFATLVNKAGIRRITLHGLRHTHATDLLRAGVHPKIASERLGHGSVAITLDTYSHAVPSLQEDAAQRIDATLRVALAGNSRNSEGGNPVAKSGVGATVGEAAACQVFDEKGKSV